MILLTTAAHPQIVEYAHPHLGRLVQPRHYSSIKQTAEAGIPWAADNDAFQGWAPERERRFVQMLDAIEGLRGCRFVACPDVVGDHRATMGLLAKWHDQIHLERRLPLAFVLQDGVSVDTVPWPYLDAVFVGGTNAFKGAPVVGEIVAEAKRRGKWAHMGRVNSQRRVRYAQSIGCDSFDGTSFSQWRKAHLRNGLAWVSGGRQLALEGS